MRFVTRARSAATTTTTLYRYLCEKNTVVCRYSLIRQQILCRAFCSLPQQHLGTVFEDLIHSQQSDSTFASDYFVRNCVQQIIDLYFDDFGEEDYLFHLPTTSDRDISHKQVDFLIDNSSGYTEQLLEDSFRACLKYNENALQLLLHTRRRVQQRKRSSQEPQDVQKRVDAALLRVLSEAYSRAFVKLECITTDSPSYALEIISASESVHPTDKLWRLRERVGYGRRVYAYSHRSHSRTSLPCTFIHVALTPEVATSMGYIARWTGRKSQKHCDFSEPFKVANFYSVGLVEPALKGTNIARYLIYDTAEKLSKEFSSIERFVTLSPIPLFRQWLRQSYKVLNNDPTLSAKLLELRSPPLAPGHIDTALRLASQIEDASVDYRDNSHSLPMAIKALYNILSRPIPHVPRAYNAQENVSPVEGGGALWGPDTWQQLKDPVSQLVSWYISFAPAGLLDHSSIDSLLDTENDMEHKRHGTLPHCPVETFHMSNGATPLRICLGANLTEKGVAESGGIMINYEYNLDMIATNASMFHHRPSEVRQRKFDVVAC